MAEARKRINIRPVYVVDGSRTPQLKARGVPGPFSATDLAVQAARPLLARQSFEAPEFDEVIFGCVAQGPDEANIGRIIALRLGCGNVVPGWTVQRNCGSGMQAIDTAAQSIASGRANLVLAGGTESMSNSPILFSTDMAHWLGKLSMSRDVASKLKVLSQFRPHLLKPVIGLLRGLTDPVVGINMGQTAEELAYHFHIDREAMDEFAVRSHQRLARAQEEGRLTEVETIYDNNGNYYEQDDGVRVDSSVEKLAKLKPVFDREFGQVTAANSAQVTDGAACVILASESAVKKYQLPIMGRLVDCKWAGLDPRQMGLGPVHAMTPLLKQHKLKIDNIDYWEINEAFAAQVLANLSAWQDKAYCREHLHLRSAFGELDQNKLNIDGGGISLGHPVGASGARIVLHLLHILKENKANKGVASLCIGGGQGGAVLLEC